MAEHKPTEQSSTAHNGFSNRAVDGKFNTAYSMKSCTHTNDESDPWWRVDLLQEYVVTGEYFYLLVTIIVVIVVVILIVVFMVMIMLVMASC